MSRVTINLDASSLENHIREKMITPNSMTEIHELLATTIDPWTPFLTGQLSQDLTIDESGVTYNVPYATDKYYGYAYTHTVHPLATSHWLEVAMQSEWEPFIDGVKDILVQEMILNG